MPTTNAGQTIPRQRNPLDFSFTVAEERRRDGLIRSAYMKIVQGFDCRPAPRSHWDETNTGDVTSWNKLLPPIRQAVSQAAFIGNKQLIDQTRDGVRAFCRELEADFLSLLPEEQEESATAIALDETQCQSEAEPLEMAFVASPSPSTAESAVLPLERHYESLGKLIKRLRIATRQARTSMAPRIAQ